LSIFSLITGNFQTFKDLENVFIEQESYEKGFAKHYHKHLKEHVVSFEERRLQALKKACRRTRISIPLLILAIALAFFILRSYELDGESVKSLLYSVVGLFILAGWWILKSLKKYNTSIKSIIFPKIISFIGDFKYSAQCSATVAQMKNSDIVPKHTIENNEDKIVGEYKDVKINLFESHLKIEQRSKNTTNYKTVFKGMVITLSMNKNFNGKTVVKRDKGAFGNWFKAKSTKLSNVKLEDPNFEKIFEVYSSDQIEARYLLTTSFMERLSQLKDSFEGKGLECSFYDNKLLIMIPVKKNLFEPGSIYEVEDFVDDSKKLLKEMNDIFQIIDILRLDYNIGL
jgi:hypothetical protein